MYMNCYTYKVSHGNLQLFVGGIHRPSLAYINYIVSSYSLVDSFDNSDSPLLHQMHQGAALVDRKYIT
jgi:hypothetical protein